MSFLHKLLIKKNLKEKIVFVNQPSVVPERKISSNCPRKKHGVCSFAKEAKTQLELFQLYMTDDFIEYIVACTQKENF